MAAMLSITSSASSDLDFLNGSLGDFTSVPVHVACAVEFFSPTNFLLMDSQRPHEDAMIHDDADSPESKMMGFPIQTRPEEVP